MKRLSFIALLFLSVFICNPFANAVEITYSLTGTTGGTFYGGPNAGWENLSVDLKFSIDSNKAPDMGGNSTYYTPDTSYLKLGQQVMSIEETTFLFMGGFDRLNMFAGNYTENWRIGISAFFDNGYFDEDTYIRLATSIDPSDVKTSYSYVYYLDNEYNVSYIIENVQLSASSGSTPVPEPGTLLLLASGFLGLAGIRKKFGN